ncbi:MAG TPA: hypothetical protein VF518_04935, partial [Polyangia bacterium]
RVYHRLLRETSAESLGPELTHELKQPIETIREVLEEGLRILSSPALRVAYEQNLAQPHAPPAASGSTPPPESPEI